ncbi:MAG: isochorismate synthase [Bacteroidetes bacterium]|nr:MAG: isochorismate synthase [Bacteroidota bacterium]TAG87435.1 MAG: isochorismate synthase [Bacteroidota bacterium]
MQVVQNKIKTSFKNVFELITHTDFSWATWRLPATTTQSLIVDFSDSFQFLDTEIEQAKSGFVISPFVNPELKQTYFIEENFRLDYSPEKNIFQEKKNSNYIDFQSFIEKITPKKQHKNWNKKCKKLTNQNSSLEKNHLDLVEKGIKAIQGKHFQKVVLSRRKIIEYPAEFDLWLAFQNLCKQYPNAFCYIFHIPSVGMWMGASPEILISTDKNNIFRTVALAGTQKYSADISLNQMVWGQKEIEEQAMVSRYIINCFKKIRLREFEEEGPKTVVAGNLAHLKTFFEVDMQATNFSQLGSVMLKLLHPTSAVCGMPKDVSEKFILENENYDREFYSGFLGPVNIDNETHIFVNLRCLQFFENCMQLYAGGGITEDSVPEKEWLETELKCRTLLDILFN